MQKLKTKTMEFKQHLGILLMIVIIFYLKWFIAGEWKNKNIHVNERIIEWYIPFAAALMVMAVAESIYWIFILLIF